MSCSLSMVSPERLPREVGCMCRGVWEVMGLHNARLSRFCGVLSILCISAKIMEAYNRSVMPFDVHGRTRATMAESTS